MGTLRHTDISEVIILAEEPKPYIERMVYLPARSAVVFMDKAGDNLPVRKVEALILKYRFAGQIDDNTYRYILYDASIE